MSQYSLWLMPLLLGGIIGLFSNLRIDWRWSAPFILQQFIVAGCAIIGLTIGPEPVWTIIGWGLFAIFNLVRASLIGAVVSNLNLLRSQEALNKAKLLRFIAWGNPAKFWMDLALIQSDYLAGNPAKAAERSAYWLPFWRVPRVYELLVVYNMLGKSLLRDWQAVIDDFAMCRLSYQSNTKQNTCPATAAVTASRAYAELNRFDESIETLESADLPAANYPTQTLDSIFLAWFALTGSTTLVETLLSKMSKTKGNMPDFAQLYWHGRCEYANGNTQTAIKLYKQALALVSPEDKAWAERISYRLSDAASGSIEENAVLQAQKKNAASRAEQIMRRCYLVSDILYSRGKKTGVWILAVILISVFAVTYGSGFLGNASLRNIHVYSFGMGVLSGDYVLKGEWWRLLTYQFLHANISHLLMNVFGLIFLGKSVENIFGTRRFLAIYFVSGVLSGVAQMLICPEQLAVGASGAVMGIFGAGAAATFRLKKVLPANIRKAELSWMLGLAMAQIMFDQIVNFASILNNGAGNAVRIASFAHIGGMASGFILGFMLPMRKFEE